MYKTSYVTEYIDINVRPQDIPDCLLTNRDCVHRLSVIPFTPTKHNMRYTHNPYGALQV